MASELKFTVDFTLIQINKNAWLKELVDELTREIKEAAKVWLNATVLLVIPVWSGASRSTFLKLSRSVGFGLTITGIRATRDQNQRALGPRVGFQQSQGKLNLEQANRGIVSFTYGTSLFHLVFNEFNNANAAPREISGLFARLNNPGPYGFQRIGKAAFEDYAKTAVQLPSPWKKKNLKLTPLRVN